ncbi:MAG: transposase [Pleurocapsa sp. SU_196_0]|nr:transposase [Pleurocapsa sp. SU_196_0]
MHPALMAMRGMDLVSATTFLAEIGDPSRFRMPRRRARATAAQRTSRGL